jgi:acyl-CoA thioester hydrolase
MTASHTVRRRLAWMDTDAAGIWHYSTVIRLSEEAETELHRNLGIQHLTFGASPRVRIEFDFVSPVTFDEEVATTITVISVGRTSVSYAVELQVGNRPIATGAFTTVLIDRGSGAPTPVPGEMREKLLDQNPTGFSD